MIKLWNAIIIKNFKEFLETQISFPAISLIKSKW